MAQKTANEWLQEGVAKYNIGKFQEALIACEEALKVDPNHKLAWNTKGAALDDLGKLAEAVAAYDEALRIDSSYENAWNNKGWVLNSMGKYAEALAAYNEVLKINPKFKEAWNNKGLALFKMGDSIEAIAAYDKALKIDIKYHNAWNNKGTALAKAGKLTEAIEAYDKALELDSKNEQAWDNKGFALNKLGKFAEGLVACEKSLELDPNNESAWNNKVISLKGLVKYEEALQVVELSLKINPKSEMLLAIKEECSSLMEKLKTEKTKPNEDENSKVIIEKINYDSCPPLKKGDILDHSYLNTLYEEDNFKLIGKGGFGKVLLVKRRGVDEKMAVKVIETNTIEDYQLSLNELSNLQKIGKHPNIILITNYDTSTLTINNIKYFQIFIEMPLATTDLENILKKNQRVSEGEIAHIIKQICAGLQSAHESNMVHMDLKPCNILLIEQFYKIADWGASIQLKSSNSTTVKSMIMATAGYRAPEVENECSEQKCNYRFCDIYSLAMLILRMCGLSTKDLKKINKGTEKYHEMYMENEIFPDLKKNKYSDTLIELIKKMSAFKPEDRISLSDAIRFLIKAYPVK